MRYFFEFQCVKLQIVIDTENGFIRLKLTVDLARELKADYFKLEDLNAETLAGVVSETVKFS